MMLRRHLCKVLGIGLTLVIVYNLLLVVYTKMTLQKLILGGVQKELHLPLSEWNGTVIKKLSHLELELQHLKESMKLAMKQQENVDKTLKRMRDEQPVQKAVEAKASETKKHRPREKLFPNSPLFKQWGEDLSEAQQKRAQDLFQKFGYNVYLSNLLPLNRSIPDTRHFSRSKQPSGPLALFNTFNYRFTILEYNRESAKMEELKANLDELIKLYNQKYPGLLKIVRHTKRQGLAQARNTGREAATAEVVAILDAHIEVNAGWAEPILARIQEDHTVIVSPVFDKINFDTFELEKYGLAVDGFNWELWCRYDSLPKAWIDLNDVTAPVKSPSIMGILAANRLFLGKIGSVDGGMLVYGGENVELSLRVWQCGGRIEVLPCSRIAHIERHHKPYALDLTPAMKRNALRVAEIWMDEYKYMVYLAWNIPLQNSGIDYGDISSRMALRENLKCKTFDWYLKNVYPALKPIHNIVGYGRIKNSLSENDCLDRGPIKGKTPIMYFCNEHSPQKVYYHLTGELYVGSLIAEANAEDCCLTDPGSGENPTLEPCSKATQNGLHIYWDFKPGRALINRATKRCLELKKASGYYMPVMRPCTTQVWTIQHTIGNWGSN
ncbi:Putative polypeptide N-acetylgalactosaminyltransferase 8 [Myotis davidii]|uniref:Polypeptide N-acetylgalactosaminyltransferase n=1 Tax=Myotis davidii TaxID=225400 RepID=L5MF15_MYODS|nr:Putative polypeptide N-acetylgalactosaminyltransferase 8 [Myotis davidii]